MKNLKAKPIDPKLLAAFVKEMEEKAIPEVIEKIRKRNIRAQKVRGWILD